MWDCGSEVVGRPEFEAAGMLKRLTGEHEFDAQVPRQPAGVDKGGRPDNFLKGLRSFGSHNQVLSAPPVSIMTSDAKAEVAEQQPVRSGKSPSAEHAGNRRPREGAVGCNREGIAK